MTDPTVCTWGWGRLSASTSVCHPTKLPSALTATQLFISKSYKLGWTEHSTYSWGKSFLDPPEHCELPGHPDSLAEFRGDLLVLTSGVVEVTGKTALVFPRPISSISSGDSQFLALDNAGQVYAWTTPLAGFHQVCIVQIACGSSHSLAVDSAGKVYSWGSAGEGCLGQGDLTARPEPAVVDGLQTRFIKQVACGALHSAVLSNTGELLTFGFNGYGQLGLGHTENALAPSLCYRLVCSNLALVRCGAFHTVALGVDGSLHAMGRGTKGQLGHGEFTDQSAPVTLSLALARVDFFTCGPDTTLIRGTLLAEEPRATSDVLDYVSESLDKGLRPQNLPAKDPKEAAAQKEIVAKQTKAYLDRLRDQEREARRQEEARLGREKQVRDNMRRCEQEVLPHWGKAKKALREVIQAGVPPKYRGEVWLRLIGSPDSSEYFAQALETTKGPESDSILGQSRRMIQLDAMRTFNQFGYFCSGSPLQAQLVELLEVFVVRRPDISYIQGMSYIAGILVMNLELPRAFAVFFQVVTSPMLLPFYRVQESGITTRFQIFRFLFKVNLPELCDHFELQGVQVQMFLFEWFATMYARPLDQEVVGRVWDLYFYFGPQVLYKTGLAILKLLSYLLLPEGMHGILKCIGSLGTLITDGDVLVEQILQIEVPDWVDHELAALVGE